MIDGGSFVLGCLVGMTGAAAVLFGVAVWVSRRGARQEGGEDG